MSKEIILLFGIGLIVLLSACSPAATAATAAPATTSLLPSTTAALASPTSPASSPQATTGATGDGQQIAAGQGVYDQDCTQCHGSKLEGSSIAPPLNQTSVANYGDAQHLEEFISEEMPQNNPGSLTQQQYYDVTAFVLNQLNLLPAGMQLTPQQASTISLQTATPTPAGNAQQGTVAVKLAQIPVVGNFLTTNRGYTLYYYDKDTPGTTNCSDNCANIFPPFTVSAGETPVTEAGISGSLGIIKRSDGSLQVSYTNQPTYNNVPLYRYYGDTEPGETDGNQYQDEWHIVSVNVATATPAPASTATPRPEGQAAIGASIYEENCTSCHGIQGQGVDAPPLRNNNFIQNQGDKTIFEVVANGRSNTEMPAWLQNNGGPLTELQINDVVAYLHTLQNVPPLTPEPTPTSEPTPVPSPTGGPTPEPAQPSISGGPGEAINLSGDIEDGQPDFGMYCAGCHGPQGVEGISNSGSDDGSVPPLNPIDPTLANSDPKTFAANVDLFIQNGSVPEGPNPLIMMPPFGSNNMLTQQQIADIIAYIISLNGVK
jgi:mono/diheme cytochrome c family protein